MEAYQSKPIDHTILKMMNRVYQQMLATSDPDSYECLMMEEKLIYTSIVCFEGMKNRDEVNQQEKKNLGSLVVNFVQKINKITMHNYEQAIQNKEKNHQRLINKSISLIMMPQISIYVEEGLLTKLKILNFNNICCIYKKLKKFGIALRSINYALELQEKMLSINNSEEKYDIVPTYLNKAAIYSDMKKHRQAIQIILKAKAHIQSIQNELIKQIQTTIDQKDKQRLIQKRYYGLYMKMIILYNMGAEKQHSKMSSQALDYYKQSKQVASIIGNQLMIKKLTNIIQSMINS